MLRPGAVYGSARCSMASSSVASIPSPSCLDLGDFQFGELRIGGIPSPGSPRLIT